MPIINDVTEAIRGRYSNIEYSHVADRQACTAKYIEVAINNKFL